LTGINIGFPSNHPALSQKKQIPALPQEIQDDYVLVTEKVDGCNGRIIILPDGYLIGSREELLHASGDLIFNSDCGIVETLRPVADKTFKDAYQQVVSA